MDSENLFAIEKLLKRRTRSGIKEIFVKRLDYPSSMNSWITEDSVQDLGVKT